MYLHPIYKKSCMQMLLVLNCFTGCFLLGMDKKYSVDQGPHHISVFKKDVGDDDDGELVKFVSFNIPAKSWQWDTTGKPVLHVTFQNDQKHSVTIEK